MDDQEEMRILNAAFRQSASARTRQEHLDAAHALLATITSAHRWVGTPVSVTIAGIHAQLAAVPQ